MMATTVASKVQALSTDLSLTQEDIAEIVGSSSRSVARWSAGESTPQRLTKRRLLELVAIGEALKEVLRSEDANLWIFAPNPLLGYDSPAERIQKGDFRTVLALIEALADGVAT